MVSISITGNLNCLRSLLEDDSIYQALLEVLLTVTVKLYAGNHHFNVVAALIYRSEFVKNAQQRSIVPLTELDST